MVKKTGEMNPRPGKYFYMFYMCSFLESIFTLKEYKDDFCFISAGTTFQIFGPKYEIVSKSFHRVFADG